MQETIGNKKSSAISAMFNSIAGEYDFLNHLLSLGTDKRWRSRSAKYLQKRLITSCTEGASEEKRGKVETNVSEGRQVGRRALLDLACGTGDSCIALWKHGFEVTGANRKEVSEPPKYVIGNAENLDFKENSFDAVTIFFGIRNFDKRERCLKEIYRVTKKGGMLAIVEFAKPRNKIVKFLYNIYFNFVMPIIGRLFSKNGSAYRYLAKSVEEFPKYEEFCSALSKAGFKEIEYLPYTFGIAVMYTGITVWKIVSFILYLMNMALAVYAAVTLILRKQDPIKTLSWVIVLILLPYIGLILYIFIGRNYIKKKIYKRKGVVDYKARKDEGTRELEALKANPEAFGKSMLPFRKLILQNLNDSHTIVDNNKKVEFYFTGRSALDAMYQAIASAKSHIHLQSYIFNDDQTGCRFKDLLIQKAADGVEVRLMIDGVGCFGVKKEFINQMRAAKIEVFIFSRVRLLLPSFLVNYRNHRKILVVDGEIGFLGGVNIADRYYYNNGEMGEWHDTHMKIIGESVASLQSSFLLDRWFIVNKRIKRINKYFPTPEAKARGRKVASEKIVTQIISSGPDSDWSSIMQCYFSAINLASDHIYIVTPYFTPNETILNAIKVASLAGIDVKIMLPERSDSKITHWSTMSYISELLDAGVNIYLFKKGFNHSKVISLDGKMSIVGSANMDVRSFEHNFEIMSVIYNSNCAEEIEKEFTVQLGNCRSVSKSKWERRSVDSKIKESLARLCGPIL